MLHAITLERFRAPVVHVHRQRHGDGALGVRRPFAIALVDVQIIGDDAKLLASHLENFVVVDRVAPALRNSWFGASMGSLVFALSSGLVKSNPADIAGLGTHASRVLVSSAPRRNDRFGARQLQRCPPSRLDQKLSGRETRALPRHRTLPRLHV